MKINDRFIPLETMGNWGINLVPFWKLEEADWVVLRLLTKGYFATGHADQDAWKAQEYLFKKYGKELVLDCCEDLKKEMEK